MDRQKIEKAIDRMTLMDDDFMCQVFDENYPGVELVLSIILKQPGIKVTDIRVQHEYRNLKKRSVRLDITAKDSAGRIMDIEVQRDNDGADVRRARYNSSMLDTRLLEKSQPFSEIVDSYVIFITEHDVLKRDLPIYRISRMIEETGEPFGDGTHIIYVNGEHDKDGTPLARLMHDFKCLRSADMNYPQLADGVRYYKETEGGREKMCKIVEELNKQTAIEIARKLITNGKLSFEEIALCSGLSVEEVKKLAEGESA
ncbi:MAG: PD-(D/E)XK nuclease family transposase [Oscillospiraceae bacterium]|nr:PD-(D/E)XK nuclease family transposase [Oscillospiraceae bacterium]